MVSGMMPWVVGTGAVAAGSAGVWVEANVPTELSFTAQREHADPFGGVTLEVEFADPVGSVRRVPAFWAGGGTWRVRYAASEPGRHRWHSRCSVMADPGLHGLEGWIEVRPYTGANPLYLHGPVRVARDRRHFEHADGTPFFWLGDTWWMGLCQRLRWPEDVQALAADRVAKGFTVIQIVAGLYPDMHPFDPRGANEAGFPWEPGYTRVRPEYFDAADVRLRYLVEQGLSPCIVGAWGYFLPWMGVERLQAHWRYLIARYGAWPVVWCTAGEANLPWYLAPHFPSDDREQVHGWTEVLRYVRETDPFRRPLTIHPTAINRYTARHATDDAALLDFDMLQTPHGQREAVPVTVRAVRESVAAAPVMPVINGEAAYEMLGDRLPTAWTRAMFWLCLMNGAKGHTYGANGIWQVNRRGAPHGPSPTAGSPPTGYGVISWDEAMTLPGSAQLAHGKRFFEALPWVDLRPLPDTAVWADRVTHEPLGDWIWYPEGDPRRDAPVAARWFRRRFTLPGNAAVRRALLRVTADDRYTVWLNGIELGSGANWMAPDRYEVTAALRPGANLIAVRAENGQAPVTLNPAGLSARLVMELPHGITLAISTDASWRAAQAEVEGWREIEFDDAAWPVALVTARYGDEPWGVLERDDPLFAPQVCGLGDWLRAIYVLAPRPILVRALRPHTTYDPTRFDPVTGESHRLAPLRTDAAGEVQVEPPTHDHDWVLRLAAGQPPG